MTQLVKTILRLYRSGYVTEAIARATGEDRTYVDYVVDSYFGRTRPAIMNYEAGAAANSSDRTGTDSVD